MKLPIEIIPNVIPKKFKYTNIDHNQKLTISFSPSVEKAITELITMYNKLEQENKKLKKQLEDAYDRIAAQSDILSRSAEKVQSPQVITKGTKG